MTISPMASRVSVRIGTTLLPVLGSLLPEQRTGGLEAALRLAYDALDELRAARQIAEATGDLSARHDALRGVSLYDGPLQQHGRVGGEQRLAQAHLARARHGARRP